MAVALKDNIGRASVGRLADAVERVAPGFPARSFRLAALAGLDGLELKARVAHVAGALGEYLPGGYGERVGILIEALDRGWGEDGWWAAWPAVEYVGAAGRGDAEVALEALGRLTGRATAEWAVRPYFDSAPDLAWRYVGEWAGSADVDRRRLASEGTRPRLPWAPRVAGLADPDRAVPILDMLRCDPEEYVRRSVANHLGDIAKDHPELAIEIGTRWQHEGGAHTAKVVRHGLRHLIRLGHAEALGLVGIRGPGPVAKLRIETPVVDEGEALRFAIMLESDRPQPVLLQYAIADGTRRKVYFLAQRDLVGGSSVTLNRQQPMRHTSTRPLRGGAHTLELIVNGDGCGLVPFEVRLAM